MALPFARHILSGDPLQFLVHDGNQPVERRLVAGAPGAQQTGNIDIVSSSGLPSHTTEYSRTALTRAVGHRPAEPFGLEFWGAVVDYFVWTRTVGARPRSVITPPWSGL